MKETIQKTMKTLGAKAMNAKQSRRAGENVKAQTNEGLGWKMFQKVVGEPVLSSTMKGMVTIHQTR
jgi:hypothetical protein